MVQRAAATVLATALLAAGSGAWAQIGELVDRSRLRVCADPNNLPFSNQAGEGFENKIAELLAESLGVGLQYTWYPGSVGFVRNTLGAIRCDLVIGVVSTTELMQNTNPYYRSSYVLIQRADAEPKVELAARRRPRGSADRGRRAHAARDGPGAGRPPRPCGALPADGRHAFRASGATDRRRRGRRSDRGRRPLGADRRLLGEPPGAGACRCPAVERGRRGAARLPHHHGAAPQRAAVGGAS